MAPGGTRRRSPASRWPWPLLWRGFCRVLPTHFLSPSGPHHAFRSPTLTFSVSLPSRSFFLTPVLLTCRPAHTRLSCDTTHLTRRPLCSPPRLPLPPPRPEASSWNLLPHAHSAPCTAGSCGVMRTRVYINVHVNMCVSQRNENPMRAEGPPSFQH